MQPSHPHRIGGRQSDSFPAPATMWRTQIVAQVRDAPVRPRTFTPAISSHRKIPSRAFRGELIGSARRAAHAWSASASSTIMSGAGGGRAHRGVAMPAVRRGLGRQLDSGRLIGRRDHGRQRAPPNASRRSLPRSIPQPRITPGCASSSPIPRAHDDLAGSRARDASSISLARGLPQSRTGLQADLAAARVLAGSAIRP